MRIQKAKGTPLQSYAVRKALADAKKEGKSWEKNSKELDEVVKKAQEGVEKKSIEEHKKGSLSYRKRIEIEFWNIHSKEEWDWFKKEAKEDYKSGKFFMERIGRIRDIDTKLAMVLVNLREGFIRQEKIKTAPEYMLLDMAMLSYFHAVRLNELIGSFEGSIEWDYFEREAPGKGGYIKGQWKTEAYLIEQLVSRITEELLPKLDLFNRMLIRNLKAIRDHKRINAQLNIESVGQLNIGEQQINTANLTQKEKEQIEMIVKASQERQKEAEVDPL